MSEPGHGHLDHRDCAWGYGRQGLARRPSTADSRTYSRQPNIQLHTRNSRVRSRDCRETKAARESGSLYSVGEWSCREVRRASRRREGAACCVLRQHPATLCSSCGVMAVPVSAGPMSVRASARVTGHVRPGPYDTAVRGRPCQARERHGTGRLQAAPLAPSFSVYGCSLETRSSVCLFVVCLFVGMLVAVALVSSRGALVSVLR